MTWLRRGLAVLTPIMVLAGGLGSYFVLANTAPQVSPSDPVEQIWPVSAETVTIQDFRPQLSLYGEVIAERPAELRSSVAGDVVGLGEGFANGAHVQAGDLLVEIDRFDYEQDLAEQQAALDEARARLDELTARVAMEADTLVRNREVLEIWQRELNRRETLAARGAVSDQTLDETRRSLVSAEQAVTASASMVRVEEARVAQQQAAIARLEAAVNLAVRNLERTRITAPFSGFVLDPQGELGQRITANESVATLIDPRRFEARFQLSETQYGRLLSDGSELIGRGAQVIWSIGSARLEFPATVVRTEGQIDAQTGGVAAFARLEPLAPDTPLRPGAFVEVVLDDRVYADVAVLPATAIHGDQVFVITDDNRVEPRQVDIAAAVRDAVVIRDGVRAGERVITTRLSEVREGARVEIR